MTPFIGLKTQDSLEILKTQTGKMGMGLKLPSDIQGQEDLGSSRHILCSNDLEMIEPGIQTIMSLITQVSRLTSQSILYFGQRFAYQHWLRHPLPNHVVNGMAGE